MCLTSINHNANHCLSVSNSAAPQQKVAAMEADANPTGMLSVEGKHKMIKSTAGVHARVCVCVKQHSHVTSEPAEIIVGILTLNTTVEAFRVEVYSLENNKMHIFFLSDYFINPNGSATTNPT